MPRTLKSALRSGKIAVFGGLAGIAIYSTQPTKADGGPRVPPIPGDMNCDEQVNMLDVPLFIDALLGLHTPQDPCFIDGDMNGDTFVDGDDIQSFVDKVAGL